MIDLTNKFIQKAIKIHSNKYDYSQVYYINGYTKIKIICPKHGFFKQSPHGHLSGNGCILCYKAQSKLSIEEFINRANKKHNYKYNYSQVDYKNSYTKIKIICPKHGLFEQIPYDHLRRGGCSKCSFESEALTREEFIQKANQIHNNKYDYSKSDYKNFLKLINIICPIHGIFTQLPYNHLRGKGCIKCGTMRSALSHESNTEEFLQKAIEIHKNKYDYSKVDYKGVFDKIKIMCSKHGVFEQTPNGHLNGQGCPDCCVVISTGHLEIMEYLKKFTNNIISNDRKVIKPYELDILIPDKKVAIEYHGLWYHSYNIKETNNEILKHYRKYIKCTEKGIRLYQIFEHEWKDKINLIKSKLMYLFNNSNRIYARNCSLYELDLNEYNLFMSQNHIQGTIYAPIRYGLKYNGDLVSAMSFKKSNKYNFELVRFANKLEYSVVGGASKLFKKFSDLNIGRSILSYADIRYSDGNLYNKLGFKLDGITHPNYFYYKSNKVYNRLKFQKHKLKKLLPNFNENLTEYQNMFNNGYRRFWDAGNFRFIKVM